MREMELFDFGGLCGLLHEDFNHVGSTTLLFFGKQFQEPDCVFGKCKRSFRFHENKFGSVVCVRYI